MWQSVAILLIALITAFAFNQFRPNKLPLMGDWSGRTQLTSDFAEGMMISLDEAEEYFFTESAIFLDARSQELYELAHIEGARSLPWDSVEERFSEVMADISSETLIITYCDEESCSLSEDLALLLFQKGYRNVRVLVNGWMLWQQNHLPIEREKTTT